MREHLSWEEVCKLDATPCKYPYLKNSFLFACFTGLRKSDIEKLTWSEIREFDGFTRIVWKQKKTGGQEYLDLPQQALKYLNTRPGKGDDLVFPGFKYGPWLLLELRRWVMAAGITKDITFLFLCLTSVRTSLLYQRCLVTENLPLHRYTHVFSIRRNKRR